MSLNGFGNVYDKASVYRSFKITLTKDHMLDQLIDGKATQGRTLEYTRWHLEEVPYCHDCKKLQTET